MTKDSLRAEQKRSRDSSWQGTLQNGNFNGRNDDQAWDFRGSLLNFSQAWTDPNCKQQVNTLLSNTCSYFTTASDLTTNGYMINKIPVYCRI